MTRLILEPITSLYRCLKTHIDYPDLDKPSWLSRATPIDWAYLTSLTILQLTQVVQLDDLVRWIKFRQWHEKKERLQCNSLILTPLNWGRNNRLLFVLLVLFGLFLFNFISDLPQKKKKQKTSSLNQLL